jgi:hypothetical protein
MICKLAECIKAEYATQSDYLEVLRQFVKPNSQTLTIPVTERQNIIPQT